MQFPDIDRLAQKTRAYSYADGLWEIAMGVFFLLIALLMSWQAQTPPKSELSLFFGLGTPILLVFGSVALGRLIKSVKARYVWPRSGYAEFSSHGTRPAVRAALIGFVAGGMFAVVYATAKVPQVAIAFTGLFSAAVFGYVGYHMGLRRFYLLAACSLIAATVILVAGLPILSGLAAFWLATGGAFLISGAYNFVRYLRTTSTQSAP